MNVVLWNMRASQLLLAACLGWLSSSLGACSEDKPISMPPLLPIPSAAEKPAAAPDPATTQAKPAHGSTPTHTSRDQPKHADKATRAEKPATTATRPAAQHASTSAVPSRRPTLPIEPTRAPRPTPVAPAPTPSPSANADKPSAKRVVVAHTANVHIEFPAGLQGDLDADPRMQAWTDKVVAIIDGCHARNRAAQGTISAVIVMHENDRPDAQLGAVPGALASVVTCATFALMQVKMPLFTGREGTRYPVRVVFEAN